MTKYIKIVCVKCGKKRNLDENNVKQVKKKYGSLEKAQESYLCRTCKKSNKEE